MPVVVSDTSPLRALAHLGHLELLGALFGDVHVPPAVARELAAPLSPGVPTVDVRDHDFLILRPARDSAEVRRLLGLLDAGEAEALALAREIGAERVLIDEKAGRGEAERMRLRPLGTVGILLQAKQAGLIYAVGPNIERLRREIRFFVSDALQEYALRLAGEAQVPLTPTP